MKISKFILLFNLFSIMKLQQNEIIDNSPQIYSEIKYAFPSTEFFTYILISIFLTFFAGLMSGLTVGFLSIDKLQLEIKQEVGTDYEKKAARKILPVLEQHHWLLVTLLLANAAAMEALPIFLDALVPSFWAVLISVTAVLAFGEVIPQAICTGSNQIAIAEKTAPLVRFIMIITACISYPISLILDKVLGEQHDITRFKNDQLKALVDLHSQKALNHLNIDQIEVDGLSQLQTKIISSTIDMNNTTVEKITTPLEKMYSLSIDEVVNEDLLLEIKEKGYSRIPIFYGENEQLILGILIVKSLIGVQFDQNNTLTIKTLIQKGSCKVKRPSYVTKTTPLAQILNVFKSHTHMAIVCANPNAMKEEANYVLNAISEGTNEQVQVSDSYEIFGLTTLEKVLEEILRISILDEKDVEKIRSLNNKSVTVYDIVDESQRNYSNESINLVPRKPKRKNRVKFIQNFQKQIKKGVIEELRKKPLEDSQQMNKDQHTLEMLLIQNQNPQNQ